MNIPIEEIPLERILTGHYNPRNAFDPDYIAELVASIKKDGQWDPIIVRARSDGKYDLIAGECRLMAHRKLGLSSIKGRILEIKEDEAHLLALKTNLVRSNLNPVEEAEGIRKLIQEGWRGKRISEELGKSQTWVSLRLKLAKNAGKGLKNAIIKQIIPLTHATEISELPRGLQGPVVEKVVRSRLNLDEIKRLVNLLKTAKTARELKSILEMPREKLNSAIFTTPNRNPSRNVNTITTVRCKCGVQYMVDWRNKRMVSVEKINGH